MNAPPTDSKVKAWSPAVACKIPDNIISSEFASSKGFMPSYERDRRPCIEQLLTNEYQRIWWQEKEAWDKRNSTKIPTKKLLQRAAIRRKPAAVPVINLPKKTKMPKKSKVSKLEDTVEKQQENEQVKEPIERQTVKEKKDDENKETA